MPNPLTALSERIALRIAKTSFVVVVKDGDTLNLIVDMGLNRPWSSKNKKHADIVAKECDGMACTFEEAFKLLLKQEGSSEQLERALVERMRNLPKQGKNKFFKSNSSEIVDSHGKPIAGAN